MILGIDEVGRGCWAGPLCVAAVLLNEQTDRTLLKDSKLLTTKKRTLAAAHIKQTAMAIGIGWASAKFIDKHGLTQALHYTTKVAVAQISADYDEIILDGTVNFLPGNPKVTLLAKADSLIPAVSAASIVAKVARDEYMRVIDTHFRGYSFAKHVGYGTAAHRQAIETLGPCSVHRMSFAPLAQLMPKGAKSKGDTTGSFAESRAARYLIDQGYTIVARNWKTRWCEIDIIALKGKTISFVEVKYRADDTAGRGLDYITKQKQRQMKFAAELWINTNNSTYTPQLSAVELSGEQFKITEFIPSIT